VPAPPLPLPDPPLADRDAGIGLRPWAAADATVLAAAWADPTLAAVTDVPGACTATDAEAWIAGADARRAAGIALDLVVAGLDDDRVGGEVGLVVRDPVRRWAELGFWVVPERRGTGLATAAVRLLSDWALGPALGLAQVYARVHKANSAAEGVLAAGGFERRGQAEGSHVVWRRRRGAGSAPGPDRGRGTVTP